MVSTRTIIWDEKVLQEIKELRNQDPQYLNEPTVPYEKQTSSTNVKE